MEMAAILLPILQDAVNWNRARVHFLAHFLVAILKVKTVNFAEIATAFGTRAKIESNYKRIRLHQVTGPLPGVKHSHLPATTLLTQTMPVFLRSNLQLLAGT